MNWLIFLSQLPTNPSSLRVTTWRKMRAMGALGLQNSAWIMPHTLENEKFIQDLLATIQQQGAGGQIFKVLPLTEAIEQDLIRRFQVEREHEYAELIERCQDMLRELEKETKKKKFTFAELEENEDELKKLEGWLARIKARDLVGGQQAEETKYQIEACKAAMKEFASQVYAQDGLASGENADLSGEKYNAKRRRQ